MPDEVTPEREGVREEYRSVATTVAIVATPVAIVAQPVVAAVADKVINGPKADPPPAKEPGK
jgi:hypothetical protein